MISFYNSVLFRLLASKAKFESSGNFTSFVESQMVVKFILPILPNLKIFNLGQFFSII